MDHSIGVPVIDRWTYYALEFLEKVTPQSKATMAEFVSYGWTLMERVYRRGMEGW